MTDAIDFIIPQQAGVLADYNAPDWEYGGGRPVSYKSADGTRFWGTLEKQGGSSGPLKLIIYHTTGSGALLGTWADSGIIGQGGLVLQPDGALEACGYLAYGDNATMRSIPVPGWVAWPAQQGPQGDPGPKGDKGDPGPQGEPGESGGGSPLWEALRQALKNWLLG